MTFNVIDYYLLAVAFAACLWGLMQYEKARGYKADAMRYRASRERRRAE